MFATNAAAIDYKVIGIILSAATLLRVLLFSLEFDKTLSHRPEFTTPINSIHRVYEGRFLLDNGKSPYAGDVFHQSPLLLLIFVIIRSPILVSSLFITLDIAMAILLFHLTLTHVSQSTKTKEIAAGMKSYAPLSPCFKPSALPYTIMIIYLFNPYTLCMCLAQSTTIITQVCVVSSLLYASKGYRVASIVTIAKATYLSAYPIVLLVPIVFMLTDDTRPLTNVLIFAVVTFYFHYVSYILMDRSWDYIHETYGFVVSYSDLTPNVGVYWYFIMEMFDRFRSFFLLILFVHPYLYVFPMALNLYSRPLALAVALFGTFTIFQTYPTMGDLGLLLSLICIHADTVVSFMYNRFADLILLSVGSMLLPVMWYIWLYPGSGNANFYYNQTLVYQFACAQLLIKFVGGTMDRQKTGDNVLKENATTDKKLN